MPGKRYAVVFGSNGPEFAGRLKYARSDAESMAGVLRSPRCGFEVQCLAPDMNNTQILSGIEKSAKACCKEDTFLCYYSGHGETFGEDLFLLLDATEKTDIPHTAIQSSRILAEMGWCNARNKLLILDCCRAGAAALNARFKGDNVELKPFLGEIQSKNFLILAASNNVGEAVELDEFQASFLTSRLKLALSNPQHSTVDRESGGVSVERLTKWLAREAAEYTKKGGLKVPLPYLVGRSQGAFYLTVTAADWPNTEVSWPDGTTMVVLPVKPVNGFALCIGKEPVTNKQYRHLIDTEPVGELPQGNDWQEVHPLRDPRFNRPEQPVVCVTLEDCQRYVDAVNRESDPERVTLLPTPAVWDYAAFQTEYPSSDPETWRQLFDPNAQPRSSPSPVDTPNMPLNSLGIGNLIGNVWQWCVADAGKTTGALRGGGFLDVPSRLLPFGDTFSIRNERISRADVGFRLAGLVRLGRLGDKARALLDVSPSLKGKELLESIASGRGLAPTPQLSANTVGSLPTGVRFPTPVRLLIAASPGLENEVAIVKESIARSWISEQITVNFCEWNKFVQDWQQSPATLGYKHPAISPWDGVLLLAGADVTSLYDLHDAARNYVTDPSRWLAYRIDHPATSKAWDGLAGFSGIAAWKDCATEQFADCFWKDHLKLLPNLVHPRQSGVLEKREIKNPYRGLESYRVTDARLFYGRSNEVSALCEILVRREHGMLAVVGPSGSGKSSLVRAGLFYRLSLDAVPGSSKWKLVDVERTESPLTATAKALYDQRTAMRTVFASSADVDASLANREGQDRIVQLILQDSPPNARVVLFFDQFEEVFTRLQPDVQTGFLLRVWELAAHPRLNVVITIRADFYTQLMGTVLGEMAGVQEPFWLRPADRTAVSKAIYWPVIKSGLRFQDDSLIAEIERDAGDDAGTLPLLSFAMQQFVDKVLPAGSEITRDIYQSLGGVKGVIMTRADEVFRQHSPTKNTVSCLFRRLVVVSENGTATKKQALFDSADGGWTKEESALMRSLVDARLLSTDKPDPGAKSYTVEIAHEALIKEWPELKKWVERSRFQLLEIQQVESAAKAWQVALDKIRPAELAVAAAVDGGSSQAPAGTCKKSENELEVNWQHLWSQERLNAVRAAMEDLGMTEDQLSPHAKEFIRDESEWLMDELNCSISHDRRNVIGARISALGDTRPGIRLRDDDRPELIWCRVPPGEITLRDDNRKPLGTFQVAAPLFISRYEVTLGQFLRFAGSQVYFEPEWWAGLAVTPSQHKPYPQPTSHTYPSQFVSFYQAIAYCRWVSKKLGYEVRLPTEWEWVQAATGGKSDYEYPWGPTWDPNRAVFAGSGVRALRALGLYPEGASPCGALDMVGNVPEWCLNSFEPVSVVDVSGNQPRPTHGGGFFDPPERCTVYHRKPDPPDSTKENLRIAVAIRLVTENPPPDALYFDV
jgi:formylglycine-generating enzyme required for sulfatase activity